MRPLVTHRYLEEERGIPRSLLEHPRFAGRILVDARSNIIFPHADWNGPCGCEVKNRGFTGFAPGGEEGLWASGVQHTDAVLVLAESGLNALSYAVLYPDEHHRYTSLGGTMSPSQPALIRTAIERVAPGATVQIATDNDGGGAGFAAIIECLVSETGSGDLAVERAAPAEAKDWNDVLRRAAGWFLQSVDRIPRHLPYFSHPLFLNAFLAAALHELAHASGHPSRLDRDLAHPFGSVGYAKEELRAEIASLMIDDWLGIGQDPGQHAAYVKSWGQVLKEDPKEILRASRDADKITGYVLGLEKGRLPTNMEKLPQVERPAAPEKAERQPDPRRVRAAGGRER